MSDALIADAQGIFEAAVRSVQADRLVGALDDVAWLPDRSTAYRRLVIAGAGKAAMAVAGAVEGRLRRSADAGLVVVPHGYRNTLADTQRAPAHVEVVEAGHPVPDDDGVRAAERLLALASSCGADDLFLVLLSGGGSALLPGLAEGISLADAQGVFRLLLRSGADIHAVNTIRKHLSRVGGGRLAAAAQPATVVALVVSDVVGDDLSVIASGPTVPDPTTFEDAVRLLHAYGLWAQLPASVQHHLERGLADAELETPKPGQALFSRVHTHLLGGNREALAGASAEALRRGYEVVQVAPETTGEARQVGLAQAQAARSLKARGKACLLWGGETTVTVRGTGKGGRNQELALAAALGLEGMARPAVLLSGGTDGLDGPTDAAGAWVTPHTAEQARRRGLVPQHYLDDNNAYAFFSTLGTLLRPGPTHTNAMDVQIALVDGF